MPLVPERGVPIHEYERTLRDLAARTRPRLEGLVLMTPYIMATRRDDPMRAAMDEYGKIVHRLSKDLDSVFVDTQAAFDAVLAYMHPMAISWDRIHPCTMGHMIIARAFLAAVGAE